MEGGLHFNVFTVDFNEELVALYGGSLLRQTHFLHESIKAILRLYKVRPQVHLMGIHLQTKPKKKENFTVSNNAESCAKAQKVCSRWCLLSARQHLKSPPQSVVVVGHSMGGVVARALYTLPRFNSNLVSLIITQASPHLAPVLSFDPYVLGKENPDWCTDWTVEFFWDE